MIPSSCNILLLKLYKQYLIIAEPMDAHKRSARIDSGFRSSAGPASDCGRNPHHSQSRHHDYPALRVQVQPATIRVARGAYSLHLSHDQSCSVASPPPAESLRSRSFMKTCENNEPGLSHESGGQFDLLRSMLLQRIRSHADDRHYLEVRVPRAKHGIKRPRLRVPVSDFPSVLPGIRTECEPPELIEKPIEDVLVVTSGNVRRRPAPEAKSRVEERVRNSSATPVLVGPRRDSLLSITMLSTQTRHLESCLISSNKEYGAEVRRRSRHIPFASLSWVDPSVNKKLWLRRRQRLKRRPEKSQTQAPAVSACAVSLVATRFLPAFIGKKALVPKAVGLSLSNDVVLKETRSRYATKEKWHRCEFRVCVHRKKRADESPTDAKS